MLHDPFEILGVDRAASPESVRRAFKRAVRRYHPDANPGDPSAAERLRAAVAAYQRITTTGSRTRIVVACRMLGADLHGTLVVDARGAGAAMPDAIDAELRALDTCGVCRGVGAHEVATSWWRVERFECEVCKGCGLLRVERRVRIRIPRNVTSGACLRLREMGLARAGMKRGDALLTISLRR